MRGKGMVSIVTLRPRIGYSTNDPSLVLAAPSWRTIHPSATRDFHRFSRAQWLIDLCGHVTSSHDHEGAIPHHDAPRCAQRGEDPAAYRFRQNTSCESTGCVQAITNGP